MDSNIVGHAMMIYRASTDCPIGCLSGLLFLKARGTDRLFLHCTDCQVAWADLPTEERNPKWTEWHQLAPKGIALPSREEIEKAGWGNAIDGESPSEEYEGILWKLWTRTAIEAGDYERAIGIADQVIATSTRPPGEAYEFRREARYKLAVRNKESWWRLSWRQLYDYFH
jgi:hypothetical protein